jgi:hypothetical protein
VTSTPLLGALFPLDHLGHYVTWHFITVSVANLFVMGLMLATFVAALLLPFPGNKKRRKSS